LGVARSAGMGCSVLPDPESQNAGAATGGDDRLGWFARDWMPSAGAAWGSVRPYLRIGGLRPWLSVRWSALRLMRKLATIGSVGWGCAVVRVVVLQRRVCRRSSPAYTGAARRREWQARALSLEASDEAAHRRDRVRLDHDRGNRL
jgi:hypothetical protein